MSTVFNLPLIRSIVSNSSEQTEKLGEELGRSLKKGDIIGLIGELGSGKTCFTRGLYKGSNKNSKSVVNSPTFVVMQRYVGDLVFYHADIYRMASRNEFLDLGIFEMAEEGVLVVEWADKFMDAFPEFTKFIEFEHRSENSRLIRIFGN